MTLFRWSKTASTNASADATISIPEGMAPSGVNDGMRAMMAAVAKWRDDTNGSLTSAGTSTSYTLTTNQGFTTFGELDGGKLLCFRANTSCGASPLMNVDGLGPRLIAFTHGGQVVGVGDILANGIYQISFYLTLNTFVLLNPSP